jgi:hypothetical protein
MSELEGQPDSAEKEPVSPERLPAWSKPVITVLDVESGTLTTSGPVADGNGSTS